MQRTVINKVVRHHNAFPRLLLSNTITRNASFEGTRYSRSNKIHFGLAIVPHAEKWVVERFGKFSRVLDSGIHFLIPIMDNVAYVHTTKEIAFEIPNQTAITKDNVIINIDGVVYVKLTDPFKASYEIEDPLFAISNLAQTTMRSEIGKMTLDKTFEERQLLNENIVRAIAEASESWGVNCLRYEIRDITVPSSVRNAMDMQAEAERKKRKQILESEGERASAENIAEGRKRAVELQSEAAKVEQVNLAEGEAKAILAKANATAEAIRTIAEAINTDKGEQAVALRVGQEYIQAFSKLAQRGNTIIVPANVNDAAGMTAQALTMFKSLMKQSNDSSISKSEALDKVINELELNKGLIDKLQKEVSSGSHTNIATAQKEQQERAANQ